MAHLRRVAVVGAGGQLGRELVAAFRSDGVDVVSFSRPTLDLERPETFNTLKGLRVDAIVNCAAWTDVDGCARDPERAMRMNGHAPGAMATQAATTRALFVQVSTNEVFDGLLDRPYHERDTPNPMNPYGASKLAGELAVAAANQRNMIIRSAWLFDSGEGNFVAKIRVAADRASAAREPLRVVADEYGNPTWAPDLGAGIVAATRLAVEGNVPPILHIAGWPAASRLDWARLALEDIDGLTIEPISQAQYVRASRVPPRAILDVSLARSLGIEPSDWKRATAEVLTAWEVA